MVVLFICFQQPCNPWQQNFKPSMQLTDSLWFHGLTMHGWHWDSFVIPKLPFHRCREQRWMLTDVLVAISKTDTTARCLSVLFVPVADQSHRYYCPITDTIELISSVPLSVVRCTLCWLTCTFSWLQYTPQLVISVIISNCLLFAVTRLRFLEYPVCFTADQIERLCSSIRLDSPCLICLYTSFYFHLFYSEVEDVHCHHCLYLSFFAFLHKY